MDIDYYASIWGLSTVDLLSASRKKNLAAGRAILFFLERRNGITLNAIGKRYSRHHATVLYGIRRVENMHLSHDTMLIRMYEEIKKEMWRIYTLQRGDGQWTYEVRKGSFVHTGAVYYESPEEAIAQGRRAKALLELKLSNKNYGTSNN